MLAAEAGSDLGAPLWFKVPDQFHELDLDEAPAERFRRAVDNATAVMSDNSGTEPLRVAYVQEAMLSQLRRQAAVYVAHCVARSEADPSKLAVAQFSILVQEAALSGTQPLPVLVNALKQPGTTREVGLADYPAGEAAVVGEEVKVVLPVTLSARAEEEERRVRQAQVLFPVPGGQHLVVVGVTSESLDDWSHYIAMLDGIARSISFTDPSRTTIADRLAGL
ncbi:hypothetical protein EIL87_07955 [Saccharopolyspora rhizosphaerae]|uniref:Uncharacterized protein n=1 Tax=Saccharopolyspora rhizosphaerae TaxID=2492662 RepID=A0A3R8QCY8_9PSEU|nr:hypothetical protein [Saccharopolyspora rhizosphaerae]RRO18171.1 hypothetical protein EIL87_07955 [Saccharopolyspora rhizosphaerae]